MWLHAGKDGAKGGNKNAAGVAQRLPPGQRCPGSYMAEPEAARALEVAARLLSVPRLSDLQTLLSRCARCGAWACA